MKKRKHHWRLKMTQAKVDKAFKLRNKGHTLAAIARALGVSPATVCNHLNA